MGGLVEGLIVGECVGKAVRGVAVGAGVIFAKFLCIQAYAQESQQEDPHY